MGVVKELHWFTSAGFMWINQSCCSPTGYFRAVEMSFRAVTQSNILNVYLLLYFYVIDYVPEWPQQHSHKDIFIISTSLVFISLSLSLSPTTYFSFPSARFEKFDWETSLLITNTVTFRSSLILHTTFPPDRPWQSLSYKYWTVHFRVQRHVYNSSRSVSFCLRIHHLAFTTTWCRVVHSVIDWYNKWRTG